jgi:hypothetical protein
VEDFALRLNGMVATLATLGEVVEEYVVVEKILRCMPPCLKQIALAITTLLDGRSLTVASLLGRLKAAKEAFEEPSSTLQQDNKLYLTEEEWDARHAWRDSKKQNSSGSDGSVRNGGHGGGDHGLGRGRGRGHRNGGHGPQKTDECWRCSKLGHWAREWQSKPKKEQAHTVQDEETSLMMARGTLFQSPVVKSEGDVAVAASGSDVVAVVDIHEEKVFV